MPSPGCCSWRAGGTEPRAGAGGWSDVEAGRPVRVAGPAARSRADRPAGIEQRWARRGLEVNRRQTRVSRPSGPVCPLRSGPSDLNGGVGQLAIGA
jgi:hypothetical protein